MSTSRSFCYNPSPNPPISGTEQIGDIAAVISSTASIDPSKEWWSGPDESSYYIVAYIDPSGDRMNAPERVLMTNYNCHIGFRRSGLKTEESFVDLTNYIAGTNSFLYGTQSKTWLNNNGYWTSYEPIETQNLLVHLDVANILSYPTTGPTWSDLKNNNDATLNPTSSSFYNNSFGGYLTFNDDLSQYATIPNIGDLSTWTVEVWFRLNTSLSGKCTAIVANQYDLGSKLNFSIGTNNFPTNSNLAIGFFNGAWRTTSGFTPVVNQWYQVVGTYDGSTLRQYVNGSANGGTLNYSGTPQSGGEVRIMRRWDSPVSASNLVDGDLQIVRIYNTALSSTQISQNWSSQKSRFNL